MLSFVSFRGENTIRMAWKHAINILAIDAVMPRNLIYSALLHASPASVDRLWTRYGEQTIVANVRISPLNSFPNPKLFASFKILTKIHDERLRAASIQTVRSDYRVSLHDGDRS